jgi:hypothetical protein
LGSDGCLDSIGGGGEGGLHCVADVFVEGAVMTLNHGTEERVMARRGRAHPRRITLPESRAAFDICKKEGDGAGGQLGSYALLPNVANSHRT